MNFFRMTITVPPSGLIISQFTPYFGLKSGPVFPEHYSLNKSIDEISKELGDRGKKQQGHKNLTSITGIGDISATILLNTIGRIEDFSDEKKLAAYFGIVPRVYVSNETSQYGRITKMGNKIGRTALVQSTLVAIKYNSYLRSFYPLTP